MKRLVLLLLLLLPSLLPLDAAAQMKRKTRIDKEFYDDGKIKKVTKTKVVQSVKIDPYTFFKKTVTHTTEYYPSGKIKSKGYRKTRIDKSAPGCYEVKDVLTTFGENGKTLHQEINECDKHRVTHKFYDDSGKVNFIRINYFLT